MTGIQRISIILKLNSPGYKCLDNSWNSCWNISVRDWWTGSTDILKPLSHRQCCQETVLTLPRGAIYVVFKAWNSGSGHNMDLFLPVQSKLNVQLSLLYVRIEMIAVLMMGIMCCCFILFSLFLSYLLIHVL